MSSKLTWFLLAWFTIVMVGFSVGARYVFQGLQYAYITLAHSDIVVIHHDASINAAWIIFIFLGIVYAGFSLYGLIEVFPTLEKKLDKERLGYDRSHWPIVTKATSIVSVIGIFLVLPLFNRYTYFSPQKICNRSYFESQETCVNFADIERVTLEGNVYDRRYKNIRINLTYEIASKEGMTFRAWIDNDRQYDKLILLHSHVAKYNPIIDRSKVSPKILQYLRNELPQKTMFNAQIRQQLLEIYK